jgi:SAM-dependent methyltransferase
MDLVVLPHALEFSENPHAILREAHRILMPEGRLVITAFNPNSLWGLAQWFNQRREFPWRGRFVSVHRLRDWLSLLDFEVAGGRFWAYAPPLQSQRWLERFAFMEKMGDRWWGVGGGVYMIEAIKRVQGVRLITPRWQPGLAKVLAPSRPTGHAHEVQKKVMNG